MYLSITSNNITKILLIFKVVSEDELPSVKKDSKESRKRKNDDGTNDSNASSTESETKKQAIAKVSYYF